MRTRIMIGAWGSALGLALIGAGAPVPVYGDHDGKPLGEASSQVLPVERGGGILYAPSEDDTPAFRAEVAAIAGVPCDYFDPRDDTPSAEMLSTYDCVFTWTNYAYDDMRQFSDNLTAYVDGGGTVVLGQWSFFGFDGHGAISTEIIGYRYCPVDVSSYSSNEYLGNGVTCLTEGVGSWSTPYRDFAGLREGAYADGSYLDGSPLFAFYPGVRVTYIAGALVGYGATGDVAQMIANACTCPRDKGDLDIDGDIDLNDFEFWNDCMTDPETGFIEPGCAVYDFEADDDIDLADFTAFQAAFTG